MVNVIPFVVKGWHARAGRRTGNPGLLPRPGSTGTAPPVGAKGTWDPADRSFRKTTSGVSRLAGQAGTQATDPTTETGQTHGSRAGEPQHPHPPCRLRAVPQPYAQCAGPRTDCPVMRTPNRDRTTSWRR